MEILRDAKCLALEYRQLTGKPLGITGEVAEYEAARLLDIDLTPARHAGYDGVRSSLLDENFNATAIYEADRDAVIGALLRPGSRARNERNAMSVNLFKRIGRRVWPT
jgi:hypothetical protein